MQYICSVVVVYYIEFKLIFNHKKMGEKTSDDIPILVHDKGIIDEPIKRVEDALSKLPENTFQRLIGTDLFQKHIEELAERLESFYHYSNEVIRTGILENRSLDVVLLRMPKNDSLQTIYCEMDMSFSDDETFWSFEPSGYTFFDGFGNSIASQLWLSDYETASGQFFINDEKGLLNMFHTYYKEKWYKDELLKRSHDLAHLLLLLRYQQMFKEAKLYARDKEHKWLEVHVLSTLHDYDWFYDTINA